MNNGKHSFVRMTKLSNVRGRVGYITDSRRQENLYTICSNVPRKLGIIWGGGKENQRDFRDNGTNGQCIDFTGVFAEKYDVAGQSALHYNKAKTNLHIHLISSERMALEEMERKIVKRNIFYDEGSKHVRTKKEILDADGNIRSGCKVIKKGDVYETNFFAQKNPHFRSKHF